MSKRLDAVKREPEQHRADPVGEQPDRAAVHVAAEALIRRMRVHAGRRGDLDLLQAEAPNLPDTAASIFVDTSYAVHRRTLN